MIRAPVQDVAGTLAHQPIVAGDIGLALGAVQDQGADALIGAGVELDAGRKRRAAQSDHAGPADALANLGRVQLRVMVIGSGSSAQVSSPSVSITAQSAESPEGCGTGCGSIAMTRVPELEAWMQALT